MNQHTFTSSVKRSAVAGISGVAQTPAPPSLINPFIAGGLKIIYDPLLYRAFVKIQPPEEAR